jgi:hypothetical protein
VAQIEASIDIPVSADEIWQLIGGFGSLPDWLNGSARNGRPVDRWALAGLRPAIMVASLLMGCGFRRMRRASGFPKVTAVMPATWEQIIGKRR